jgi:membrane fusion protein, multidrug efflux system
MVFGKKAFLGVLILGLASCAPPAPEQKVDIVRPVKTMTIGATKEARLAYPGQVKANQQVDLAFRVSGPLIELPIKEGDKVEKDQILARIDPRDFEIALGSATAEFDKAAADLKRAEALYKGQAISKAEFEEKKARNDIAKSKMEQAQADLDDSYLRAPFAGTIGKRYIDNFQNVTAKQVILTLQDMSQVEVFTDIPEMVIAKAKKENFQRFTTTFSAFPGKEFDLTVKEFSTKADETTQTFRVTFLMSPEAGLQVLPGMTAEVNIYVSAKTGKKVIPSRAVTADADGKSFVWLVNPEQLTVQRQDVELGQVTGTDQVEVLSGLETGQIIVTAGVAQLHDGMKISLLE